MTDRPGGSRYAPGELCRDNLRVAFRWLGPPHDSDLDAFSLTFVLTEARGAEVLDAVHRALRAAAHEALHETRYALDKLAWAIGEMAEPFVRTIRDSQVDRRTWLQLVQPAFAWAADVPAGEGAGVATPGPSGLQTGVIQVLDVALDVPRASLLANAARDGRRFMPGHHRRFLARLDEVGPILRVFVERAGDPRLTGLYNECVRNLRTFRVVHHKRDDARVTGQTTVVEVDEDPVATFEHTMAERALYFIRSGSVRIAPPGEGLPAGRLGPGEIFGEVAFLLNYGAAAGVVAEEELEVDVVGRDELHQLLELDVALAARLYKALGVLEAERLGDVARRAGSVQLADVRMAPDPRVQPAGVPTPSTEAIVRRMLAAAEVEDVAAVVGECDRLVRHLAELSPDEAMNAGRHVLRTAFPVLGASYLLRAAMLGPGRARRDAVALEHVLDGVPLGDGAVGEAVDRWALQLPTMTSLRARTSAVADAVAPTVDDPGRGSDEARTVTCVESLPGPELLSGFGTPVELIVVDSDAEALRRTHARYPSRLRTVHESVVHLARGLGRIPMAAQDAVYCVGALQHLDDRDAVGLIDWAHAALRPGGALLLGGPATTSLDAAFLEHIVGWAVRRRSPEQMAHLFSRSDFLTMHARTWTDAAGGMTYALSRREGGSR